MLPQLWILVKRLHGAGQVIRVPRRDQEPGLSVNDDFQGPPVGCSNDGLPRDHGFDQNPSERFGRGGGEDEDIQGGHDLGHVVPISGPDDPVLDAQVASQLVQLLAPTFFARHHIPNDNEPRVWGLRRHFRRRL